MATEVVSTIRASSGDYPSLSAWEAAEQRDLVSADEIAVAECYNDWPSGLNDNVEFGGWTTDATRKPVIRVADGHRHDGTPGTGFWMYTAKNYTGAIECNGLDLDVIGIEAHAAVGWAFWLYSDKARAIDCIGKSTFNNANYPAFFGRYGTFHKCLAFDSYYGYGHVNYRGGTYYNCIAANCSVQGWLGIGNNVANSASTAVNCVGYNNGTDFGGASWYTASCSNNASSDYAGDPPPGSNPYTSDVTSADFADAANDDFHLDAGSALASAGTDHGQFVEDIDGDTISTWPIGFDTPVASGHTLAGDNAAATSDADTGALTQTHTLAGQDAEAAAGATTGAVSSAATLAGDDAQAASSSTTGALVQSHALAGDDATATSDATTGAISATTTLAGDDAQAGAEATAGAVTQSHTLAGADAAATTDATTGAVGSTGTLAGSDAESASSATTGAITQTHALAGADAAASSDATTGAVDSTGALGGQDAEATAGATAAAIIQLHVLSGDDASAEADATTGAVGSGQTLAGDDAAATAAATTAQIIQLHALTGDDSEAAADATTGAVTAAGVLVGDDAEAQAGATTAQIIQFHTLAGVNAVAISDASVKALPGEGIGWVRATCLLEAEPARTVIPATPERSLMASLDNCA